MPNFNSETGLPYGVVQGNNLQPDLLDELYFKALAIEEERLIEEEAEAMIAAGKTFDSAWQDEFLEGCTIDEPSASFEYEGIHLQYSWLGGAPIVFSFNGPVQNVASYCSPCVPGAADLDSGEGEIECHGFPPNWYSNAEQEVA